jgi:predicted DNA-binding protein (UPF0251 family)/DNA-directed RNA polymerase subunit RPC12/RpoP
MSYPPIFKGFKPYGGQSKSQGKVLLLLEEFESIRLMDFELLTQSQGALQMDVSRPTFTRIYESARQKIAKAIVLSLQLEIDGGNVAFKGDWYSCAHCEAVFELNEENNTSNMYCPHCNSTHYNSINRVLLDAKRPPKKGHQVNSEESSIHCICETCGLKISHKRGVPCRQVICPQCKTALFRE